MLLPHGVPGNLLQTSLLVTSQRSRNICFTDQPLVFRLDFSHLNLFIPLPTGLFGASVLSHYVLWTVCTPPPHQSSPRLHLGYCGWPASVQGFKAQLDMEAY